MMERFVYKATITKVYDGDTVTADIDLGLEVWVRGQKLRLFGINAPELRGADRELGIKSRDFLRDMIGEGEVIIRTHKDTKGKYGRWLAEIFVDDHNVNKTMVEYNHAIEAVY